MDRLHRCAATDLLEEDDHPSPLTRKLLRANLPRTAPWLTDCELAMILAEIWAMAPQVSSEESAAAARSLLRYRNGDHDPVVLEDVDRALARIHEALVRKTAPALEKAARLVLLHREMQPAPPLEVDEEDWALLLLRFATLFRTLALRARGAYWNPLTSFDDDDALIEDEDVLIEDDGDDKFVMDGTAEVDIEVQELGALRLRPGPLADVSEEPVFPPFLPDPLEVFAPLDPEAEEATLRLLRRFFTKLRC